MSSPAGPRVAWVGAFPYATTALAAVIAFVVFGLVAAPHGDQARRAAVAPEPAPVIARANAGAPTASRDLVASVARDDFPASTGDAFPPAMRHESPSSSGDAVAAAPASKPVAPATASESADGMGSPRHGRVAAASASRTRPPIVRVRHEEANVAARVRPEVVMTAATELSARPMAPMVLFVSAAPALVEVQAP